MFAAVHEPETGPPRTFSDVRLLDEVDTVRNQSALMRKPGKGIDRRKPVSADALGCGTIRLPACRKARRIGDAAKTSRQDECRHWP
jgi:hypothetical protein